MKDVLQNLFLSLGPLELLFEQCCDCLAFPLRAAHRTSQEEAYRILSHGVERLCCLSLCEHHWKCLESVMQRCDNWLSERIHTIEGLDLSDLDKQQENLQLLKEAQSEVHACRAEVETVMELQGKVTAVVHSSQLEQRTAELTGKYDDLCKRASDKLAYFLDYWKWSRNYKANIQELESWCLKAKHANNQLLSEVNGSSDITLKFLFEKLEHVLALQGEQEIEENALQNIRKESERAVLLLFANRATVESSLNQLSERFTNVSRSLEDTKTMLLSQVLEMSHSDLHTEVKSRLKCITNSICEWNIATVACFEDVQDFLSKYKRNSKELHFFRELDRALQGKESYAETDYSLHELAVSSYIQTLNRLLSKWHEFDSMCLELREWLAEKEKVLSRMLETQPELCQDRLSIQKVYYSFKGIAKEVKCRREDYHKFQEAGKLLKEAVDSRSASDYVDLKEKELNARFQKVTELISELSVSVERQCELWNTYSEAVESADSFLRVQQYMLSLYKEQMFSPKHLNSALVQIESIQQAVEEKKATLFQQIESRAAAVCTHSDVAAIEADLNASRERWQDLEEHCTLLANQVRQSLNEWSNICFSLEAISDYTELQLCGITLPVIRSFIGAADCESIIADMANHQQTLKELLTAASSLDSTSSAIKPSVFSDLYLKINSLQKSLMNISLVHSSSRVDHTQSSEAEKACEDARQEVANLQAEQEYLREAVAVLGNSKQLAKYLHQEQELMLRVSKCIMHLQAKKVELLEHQNVEPSAIEQITDSIHESQQLLSTITSHWFYQVRRYADSATLDQKCCTLLKFLGCSMLSLRIDTYDHLLESLAETVMVKTYLSGQEYLMFSVVKEGLSASRFMDLHSSSEFLSHLDRLLSLWNTVERACMEKQNYMLNATKCWHDCLCRNKDLQSLHRIIEAELTRLPISGVDICRLDEQLNYVEGIMVHWRNFCTMERERQDPFQQISAFDTTAAKTLIDMYSARKQNLRKLVSAVEERKAAIEQARNSICKAKNVLASFREKIQAAVVFAARNEGECDILPRSELISRCSVIKREISSVADSTDLESVVGILEPVKDQFMVAEILEECERLRAEAKLVTQRLNIMLLHACERRDRWPLFHTQCGQHLSWCENMEGAIKHSGDPLQVLKFLQCDAKAEIENKTSSLLKITSLGESLVELTHSEDRSQLLQSIKAVKDAHDHVEQLRRQRLDAIRGIVDKKAELEYEVNAVQHFLSSSEKFLISCDSFTLENIVTFLQKIQAIQQQQDELQTRMDTVKEVTYFLVNSPDAFFCSADRDVTDRTCQSLTRLWYQVRTLCSEYIEKIQKAQLHVNEMQQCLDSLEQWLEAKEQATLSCNCSSLDACKKSFELHEDLCLSIDQHSRQMSAIKKHRDCLIQSGLLQEDEAIPARITAVENRWLSFCDKTDQSMKHVRTTLEKWQLFYSCESCLSKFMEDAEKRLHSLEEIGEITPLVRQSLQDLNVQFEKCKKEVQKLTAMAEDLNQQSCVLTTSASTVETIRQHLHNLRERLQRLQDYIENSASIENSPSSDLSSIDATLDMDEIHGLSGEVTDVGVAVESNAEPIVECDMDLREFIVAVEQTKKWLDATEQALLCTTPRGFDNAEPVYDYSHLLAACRSSIDVLRHFSRIVTENYSNNQNIQSMCLKAEGLLERWNAVEVQTVEKERRVQQNREKWQSFLQELQNVELWLKDASSSYSCKFQWENVAAGVQNLEAMMDKYKELLSEITEQKKVLECINLLSQEFTTAHSSEVSRQLKERVQDVNEQWKAICTLAKSWQIEMRSAVSHSAEFQESIRGVKAYIEKLEWEFASIFQCNEPAIQRRKLLELGALLEKTTTKVTIFERLAKLCAADVCDISDENSEASSWFTTQNELSDVLQRISSLSAQCEELSRSRGSSEHHPGEEMISAANGHHLAEGRLADLEEEEEDNISGIGRCCNYLMRVIRASFPIQALLLMLLGAAALFPAAEDELSCQLTNNFARSLNPMLQHPQGPPPV